MSACALGLPQGLGRFYVPNSQVDELRAEADLVHQVRDAIAADPNAVAAVPVAVAAVEEPVPAAKSGYTRAITHCTTGEVIYVNEWSINAEGCTVGPCGEMVCPQGNRGVGGDAASFRGNKGPGYTGSNGNAAPLGSDGRAVDPAAITYLKQIEAYKIWAEKEAKRG